MITIKVVCPLCKKESFVVVRASDYTDWQEGTLAQIAFPYLTPTQREILISGFCEECQETLFDLDEAEA